MADADGSGRRGRPIARARAIRRGSARGAGAGGFPTAAPPTPTNFSFGQGLQVNGTSTINAQEDGARQKPNPFAPASSSFSFSLPSQPVNNPFAPPQSVQSNPFTLQASNTPAAPFIVKATSAAPFNFGAGSVSSAPQNAPSTSSTPFSFNFGAPAAAPSSATGGVSNEIGTSSTKSSTSIFGAPATQSTSFAFGAKPSAQPLNPFATPAVASAPLGTSSAALSGFGKAPSTDLFKFGKPPPMPSDNDSAAARQQRFDGQLTENRYLELKPQREKERAEAIRQGLIPDPNVPRRLDEAVTFIGTCQEMCPEFEREEREYQNNLESWELRPGTKRVDPARAVKAFHRPAAGNEQALPSDVRPPQALKKTLDYLINTILPQDPTMEDSHGFVRDRTRSIRQDFTVQNNRGLEAVECHERIARYHILTLHQLCQNSSFSEQQETEQLRKVLQSLTEFYDDLRREGVECPNESEFRAYYFISHLRDQDILRQAELLPQRIFQSSWLQTALSYHALAEKNNEQPRRNKPRNHEASLNFFTRFFKNIASPDTPYLMACMLEWHFVDVRKGAFKSLRKAYLPNHKAFPIDKLTVMLGFDDELEAARNAEYYGLEVEYTAANYEGGAMTMEGDQSRGFPISVALHKSSPWEEPSLTFKQVRSMKLVEAKKGSMTLSDVVNGRNFRPSPIDLRRPSIATPRADTQFKPTKSLAPFGSVSSISAPSFSPFAITPAITTPSASPFAFNLPASTTSFSTTLAAPFSFNAPSTVKSIAPEVPVISQSASIPRLPTPPPPPKPKYTSGQIQIASDLFVDKVSNDAIKSVVANERLAEQDRRAKERRRKIEEEKRRRRQERQKRIQHFADSMYSIMVDELLKESSMPGIATVKSSHSCLRAGWQKWRQLHVENIAAQSEFKTYQHHILDVVKSVGFRPTADGSLLNGMNGHLDSEMEDADLAALIDRMAQDKKQQAIGRLTRSLLETIGAHIPNCRRHFDVFIQPIDIQDVFSKWSTNSFGLKPDGCDVAAGTFTSDAVDMQVFLSPNTLLASNAIGFYIYEIHRSTAEATKDLERLKATLDAIEESNKVYIGVILISNTESDEYLELLSSFIEGNNYRSVRHVASVTLHEMDRWEDDLTSVIKDLAINSDYGAITLPLTVETIAIPLTEAFGDLTRGMFSLLEGATGFAYLSGFNVLMRLIAAYNHGIKMGFGLHEAPVVVPLPDEESIMASGSISDHIAAYFTLLEAANNTEAITMLRMDVFSRLASGQLLSLAEIAARCLQVILDRAEAAETEQSDTNMDIVAAQFAEWAAAAVEQWRAEYTAAMKAEDHAEIRKRAEKDIGLDSVKKRVVEKGSKASAVSILTNGDSVHPSRRLSRAEELQALVKNVRREMQETVL